MREPDAGNPHVRFAEGGRVAQPHRVARSSTLPVRSHPAPAKPFVNALRPHGARSVPPQIGSSSSRRPLEGHTAGAPRAPTGERSTEMNGVRARSTVGGRRECCAGKRAAVQGRTTARSGAGRQGAVFAAAPLMGRRGPGNGRAPHRCGSRRRPGSPSPRSRRRCRRSAPAVPTARATAAPGRRLGRRRARRRARPP